MLRAMIVTLAARTGARVERSTGVACPPALGDCVCVRGSGHLASQPALPVLGVCTPPSAADAISGCCRCSCQTADSGGATGAGVYMEQVGLPAAGRAGLRALVIQSGGDSCMRVPEKVLCGGVLHGNIAEPGRWVCLTEGDASEPLSAARIRPAPFLALRRPVQTAGVLSPSSASLRGDTAFNSAAKAPDCCPPAVLTPRLPCSP